MSPAAFAEDVQIRPFLGVTFGGSTTLLDFADSTGKANVTLGVSAAVLGDVFGAEVELADAPDISSRVRKR